MRTRTTPRPARRARSRTISTDPATRVLVVGLGTISRTHLAVLGRRSDVVVVGGVDPVVTSTDFPVLTSLDGAAALEPDLVVVATPTETHVDLVRRATDLTDGLVLSEKPLATTPAGLASLDDVADRIRVAHHFAFSPEVEWALQVVRQRDLGVPTRVLSTFNDAYSDLPPEQLRSYVSPWVDSAPNQLSLLTPFVGACTVVDHADLQHRAVTTLDYPGGRCVLSSNWLAADTSKQTVLDYEGLTIRIDHTSLTATLLEGGEVREHVGYTGTLSRKDAHYAGLYETLLADPDDGRLSVGLAQDIARLLEEAATAPAGATLFSALEE